GATADARVPGTATIGACAATRPHPPQYSRHHRSRLPGRAEDHPLERRGRAGNDHPRNEDRTARLRPLRVPPGGGGGRARGDLPGKWWLRLDRELARLAAGRSSRTGGTALPVVD